MGKPAISFATGQQIKTGSNSDKFRGNWDDIFNNKEKKKAKAKEGNDERDKADGTS